MRTIGAFFFLIFSLLPASLAAQTGWQNRQVIASNTNFPPSNGELPQLGLDSAGNGFLAYQSDANQAVGAFRPAGSTTWNTPVELTVPDDLIGFPRLSVSPAGRALVAFVEGSGPQTIRSAPCDAGVWTVGSLGNGAWTAGITPSDIGVAVNDNGAAAIVWVEGTDFKFVRRTDAGVWDSTPQTATLSGLTSFSFPKLHLDNSGNMVVVWQQGTTLLYSFFTPGTSWGTPQTLVASPERFALPVTAGDAVGRSVVVAARHSGQGTGNLGGRAWRISTANGAFTVVTDDSATSAAGAEASAGFVPGTDNAAVGFSQDPGDPRLNVVDAQSLDSALVSDAALGSIVGVASTLLAGGEALVLGTTQFGTQSIRAYTKAAAGSSGILSEETVLDTSANSFSAPAVAADRRGRATAMYHFAIGLLVTYDYVGASSVQSDRIAVRNLVPNTPQVTVVNQDVTIVMEKLRARRRARAIIARAARKGGRVRYQSVTERTSDLDGTPITGEVIRRITKRNTFTLKNLPTGNYRTKYRGLVTITRPGKPDKVRRTKFSPSASFTVEVAPG